MAAGLAAPHMPVRYSPRGLSSSVWVCCSSSVCGQGGGKSGMEPGCGAWKEHRCMRQNTARAVKTKLQLALGFVQVMRSASGVNGHWQCDNAWGPRRPLISAAYRDGLAGDEQRQFVGEVVAVVVQQVVRLGSKALRPQLADHVAHQGEGQQRGAVGCRVVERGAGARGSGASEVNTCQVGWIVV